MKKSILITLAHVIPVFFFLFTGTAFCNVAWTPPDSLEDGATEFPDCPVPGSVLEADMSDSYRRDSASRDACSLLKFEHRIETPHFVLKWTNKSAHEQDNIADPAIIEETAGYLETAWQKYVDTFGKTPYVARGKQKIQVVFRDLDCYGQAGPPEDPIRLDADNWVKKPGIRRPTSAHELFHKLQYSFGYRTRWNPKSPFKWFTEGTAAWAEVFVWQRVSGAYKVKELYAKPDLDLYESEDCALPFWLFFETRYQSLFNENPMVAFFREYERTGKEKTVLARMTEKLYGPVDRFFALFSAQRQMGFLWPSENEANRISILGPDGKAIVPKLKVNEVPVAVGERYRTKGSVSRLGTGYYRFKLPKHAQGRSINVSVTGGGGEGYSCTLAWEKDGRWRESAEATNLRGGYGFSDRLDDLEKADSLMLIVSGTEKGGRYSVEALLN